MLQSHNWWWRTTHSIHTCSLWIEKNRSWVLQHIYMWRSTLLHICECYFLNHSKSQKINVLAYTFRWQPIAILPNANWPEAVGIYQKRHTLHYPYTIGNFYIAISLSVSLVRIYRPYLNTVPMAHGYKNTLCICHQTTFQSRVYNLLWWVVLFSCLLISQNCMAWILDKHDRLVNMEPCWNEKRKKNMRNLHIFFIPKFIDQLPFNAATALPYFET